jgi:uncharacterized peroxidase-related enzyme
MTNLKLHTLESAPEASRPILEQSLKSFGMIPNLHAVLAESPQTLQAYTQLHQLFTQTGFDASELTVVWQTINVENNCHYCVPAHSAIAAQMKVDKSIVDAIRMGEPLSDEKLQVLREATLALVRNRGHLSDQELERFYQAGYGNKHLLDIILAIAQKTISNYANHLADTPLDDVFKPFAESPGGTSS